jgi:hypothetical protein
MVRPAIPDAELNQARDIIRLRMRRSGIIGAAVGARMMARWWNSAGKVSADGTQRKLIVR